MNFSRKSLNTKSNLILEWRSIKPYSKVQKYVYDARKSFEIGNGISFLRKLYGFKEYVGISGKLEDGVFSQNIILKSNILLESIRDLRSLALTNLLLKQGNYFPYFSKNNFVKFLH